MYWHIVPTVISPMLKVLYVRIGHLSNSYSKQIGGNISEFQLMKLLLNKKFVHGALLKLIISSNQERSPTESFRLSCLKQIKSFIVMLPLFERQISELQLFTSKRQHFYENGGKHMKPLSYCWAQRLTCAFKILQPPRRTWSCSQTLFSLFMWKQ